ncbi:MAG: EAL domain-containing protein [Synergistaceae bacterium]|nr:EAL domain-containing protein [Synergistaceae bacterium]
MKNLVKARLFGTRTFLLLSVMLFLLGSFSYMLLLRAGEIYKTQDREQISSVAGLASHIVNERIKSHLQIYASLARMHSETVSGDAAAALEQLNTNLNTYRTRDGYEYLKHFFVADLDGSAESESGEKTSLWNLRGFQSSIRGFVSTSGVIFDPLSDAKISGREQIAAFLPVYLDARLIGSLAVIFPLKDTQALLSDISIPYSGASLFIVDENNSVIAHSGVFTDPLMYLNGGINFLHFMDGILNNEEKISLGEVLRSERQEEAVRSFHAESTSRVVSFAPLTATDGWKLITLSSDDSIRHFQRVHLRNIVFAFVVLFFLMSGIILLVYFYSSRSHWLQRISQNIITTSGLHLFYLTPEGKASGFSPSFTKALSLPDKVHEFNFTDYMDKGRKIFPLQTMEPHSSFRFPFTAPGGERLYLYIHILDEAGHGASRLAVAMDVSKDEAQQRRIHDLAYIDRLTKLPNNESFNQRMSREMKGFEGKSVNAACCFVSIDDKERIRDIFGGIIFQKTVAAAAGRIAEAVRELDAALYSVANEDFVLRYDYKDDEELQELGRKIREAFLTPMEVDGNVFEISCSVGVVTYNEWAEYCDPTLESLFRNGEMALKLARENHGFYILDGKAYLERIRYIDMELELMDSIRKGELHLHFQPIYDAIEDRIASVEALARWKSSKYGPVSPGVFIPMAEQTGFINTLGDWVIERCVEFAKELSARGVSIEFNVSTIQLAQMNFGQKLTDIVKASGLPSYALGMEITESKSFDETGTARKNILQVKEAGIPIYIDDFGTGYSSFSWLRDLSPDWRRGALGDEEVYRPRYGECR